ncbi:putative metal-dependent HD superfamily phosphohydrolase [Murinocardiopsis flavida]|uniref:Putative metal-dependent HD superfamily phosphohydrolase n=1 Tax=Murinocardiopsis flavida TaxID=645275 RepID=A0A2P8DH26_9ACTN|nr:metal-dependent phosphohydrolase [Murinocardiopsis flavida]PSK96479.1 putative metal-dependent HD superfamily phosphohydrolase [Murinocardiopsis flavida]
MGHTTGQEPTGGTADLSAAWRRLAGPAAAHVGAELLARWAEPHRRYHGQDHLRAVLAAVDLLSGSAADPDTVRFAAWFHDAVYQGEPGADEEASALLAERLLPRCGIGAARTAAVARLVRATARHAADPADRDAAVLFDADLAVLAGTGAEYAEYAAAVRAEYAHVADADFRVGRAAVLRSLLDRPALFGTEHGRERWERRARANVAAEIALLESATT